MTKNGNLDNRYLLNSAWKSGHVSGYSENTSYELSSSNRKSSAKPIA
ncbi:MAG: hypothetical protein ACJAS1_002382 [Oleiphilaceae bacterium]|jgi:hypothetical protein